MFVLDEINVSLLFLAEIVSLLNSHQRFKHFVLQVTALLQVFSKQMATNRSVDNALEMCIFVLLIQGFYFFS